MALGMGNCVQGWFGKNGIKVNGVWTESDEYLGEAAAVEFGSRRAGLENSMKELCIRISRGHLCNTSR